MPEGLFPVYGNRELESAYCVLLFRMEVEEERTFEGTGSPACRVKKVSQRGWRQRFDFMGRNLEHKNVESWRVATLLAGLPIPQKEPQ